MRMLGIDQWQNGYPDRSSVMADLKAGVGRVAADDDGRIAAYAAVIFGHEPNYDCMEAGRWTVETDDYVVVHRIAVDDAFVNRGVATDLMRQIENEALFRGTASFRIDTHRDNGYMRAMLAKLGFVRCGVIRVGDGTPREAYEKPLPQSRNAPA